MPRARHLAALLASTSLCAAGALANPTGGQIVAGGGSIVQSSPNTLTINQQTQSLVLNWQSFSIGANQQVVFQQPGASSIALNRVLGGDPSTIAGQLTANGQVWLINANGVFFAPGARINVAGIVATTSNIGTANFMAGNYVFGQPGAANGQVVNAGNITVADAGLAAFVAPQVANSGVIAAKLGKVSLDSASKFTVDLYGDNLVKIAVDDRTGAQLSQAAVSNTGKIKADGGTVVLAVSAAEAIVNSAINVGGTIEARSASMKDGKIVLSGGSGTVNVTGTLDASGKAAGETGGTVDVVGSAVNLGATAKIDVSGSAGGGTALVGGNFHGAGPGPKANSVTMSAGAVIDADALQSGTGGSVALWSQDATNFAGSITARGAGTGAGGYVETSSANRLTVADGSVVDTSAASGQSGEWLLDPTEIEITTSATSDTNVTSSSPFTSTGTGSTISNTTIDNALHTGDVVVETSVGDIVLDAGADLVPKNNGGANNSLALDSAANIVLNGNINFATATGGASSGNLFLLAGGAITQSGATITMAGGTLSMSAGTGIGMGGAVNIAAQSAGSTVDVAAVTVMGDVSLAATTGTLAITSAGAQTLSGIPFAAVSGASAGGTVSITGGTVTLSAPVSGATVTIDATTTGIVFDDATGTLVSTTGGGQSYTGAVTLAANASLSDSGGGTISFANTIDGASALNIATSTGTISFAAALGGTTPLGSVSLSDATLDLGGNIMAAGSIAETGATILTANSTVAASAGNVAFDGTIDGDGVATRALTVDASGTTTLSGAVGGATALGAVTLSDGNLDLDGNITAAGPIAETGATILTAGVTVDATAGNISFGSTVDGDGVATRALTLDASGMATLGGAVGGGTALGSVSLSDTTLDLGGSITASGPIAETGATILTHNVTVDATAGNVTFGSTIDGDGVAARSLTVDSSGTIALSANVGGGTALGSVTLSDAMLDLGGNVMASGTIAETGATVLGANVTVASSAGSVSFGGTIDGDGVATRALTLDAANTVTLVAAVGGGTALGIVTLSDATLRLGGNITAAGAIAETGATILTASVTVDATAGNVSFGGTIDGDGVSSRSLTLDASGTVSLAGAVGGSTRIGGFTLSDATLDLGGNISTTGRISETGATVVDANVRVATSTNSLSFGGPINGDGVAARSLTIAAVNGTATLSGAVGGSTALGSVALSAGTFDLGANITAAGPIAVTGPTVLTQNVTIDATAGNVSFSSTINGDGVATRALTVDASGTVTLLGAVGGTTALGGVTLSDATLDLGGNVTAAGPIAVTGATILTANSTVAASAGNVSFSSTIDGDGVASRALTLKATSGTIALSGAVGGSTGLGSVTLSDTTLDLGGSITATGAIAETGVTILTGNSTVAASAGNITFSSTIDGDGVTARALTLTAPSHTITLDGALGGTTALASVTLSDATLDLGANIAASGGIVQTGATVLGATVTVASSAGSVRFAGSIDGDGVATRALTLDGAATVVLGGAVGGATALGSVMLSDATLDLGGNVTAAGPIGETGVTILTANSTVTASSGNVSFSSTIDGDGVAARALTVQATSGTIALGGAVGGGTVLGALSLTDSRLNLGVNVATSGAFGETGATILGGNVTVASSGGNVAFSSTIDGDGVATRAVTLDAAATVTLSGVVGGSTALGLVTLSDNRLDLGANVTSQGFIETGNTTLAGSDTISTPVGNVTFSGTIDGDGVATRALTITDAGGTIALLGSLGGTTALGAVTLSDTLLQVGANVNVTTSGGAFTQNGVTLLMALGATPTTTTIDTTNGGASSGAAISFSSAVNDASAGLQALSLTAGSAGQITFSGNVGATTALGAVTLITGGPIDIAQSLATSNGSLSITSGNAIAINGTVTTGTGGITLLAGLVLDIAAPLGTSETGAMRLSGTSLNLAAAIDGGSTLTISPIVSSSNIGLGSGASDTFRLTQAALNEIGTDFTSVTIATTTGTVHINNAGVALTFSDPTRIGGAAIQFQDSGGFTTSGKALTLAGAVTLAGSPTLDTTGGGQTAGANVTLTSTVTGTSAGAQSLTIKAGSGGTISLGGTLGSSVALGAVSLSDFALDLAANVGITTDDAPVTETGKTVLQGSGASANTVATSGGAIDFTGTIDGDISGLRALTLNAGAGTITLGGTLGGTTNLGTVTLTDALLDLAANVGIDSTGNVTQSGATVLQGSGTASATTIIASGGTLSFAGAIDGDSTGLRALTLNAGAGTISLGGSLGNTTPLGAVSLSDGTLDLAAGVGIFTAGGNVSQAGATLLQGAGPSTTTIATSGGAIALGAVNASTAGGQSLDLDAGAGTVTLGGNVGATTNLGALTLSDGRLIFSGTVSVSLADSGFSQSAPTELTGGGSATAVTIATNGGNITFASTIDDDVAGRRALSLNAGAGTIALEGNVGGGTALGALGFTDATLEVSAGVTIATDDAAVSQTGALLLLGSAQATTTITTAGGNISLGAVDDADPDGEAIALNAGTGTITLGGSVGGITPVAAVTLSDALLDFGSNLEIVSYGAVVETGNTVLLGGVATSDEVLTDGSPITFTGTIDGTTRGLQALTLDTFSGSGTITLDGTLGGTTALGALTFSDGTLELGLSASVITSGGAILNSGETLLLGGASTGTVVFDTTDGGRAAGAGMTFANEIDTTGFGAHALTLDAGTGTITLLGNLSGNGALGAVTLSDSTLFLASGTTIVTSGGSVTQNGATVLEGGAAASQFFIDTACCSSSSGNITFNGPIDGTSAGAQSLLFVVGTGSSISLQGNLGGTTPLGAVTLDDSELVLGGNIVTASGAVSQTTMTLVSANVTIDTTAGGSAAGADITFSTLERAVANPPTAPNVTMDAGTATISLSGGTGSFLIGSLTLSDAELDVAPGAQIEVGDAFSETGRTVLLASVTPAPVVIEGLTGETFDGPIDGGQSLSTGAGSTTSVVFEGNIGGTTPLAGFSVDGAVELAPNLTIAAGTVALAGSIVLEGNGAVPTTTRIDTSSSGDPDGQTVSLNGTIDGTVAGLQSLQIVGSLTLAGNTSAIGATTPLGAISMDNLTLGENTSIKTAGGAVSTLFDIDLSGSGLAASSATIDTTADGASAGANISASRIEDTVSGYYQALTLNAGTGGTISIAQNIGASNALGALYMNDAILVLGSSGAIATQNGAVTQTGATTLLGGVASVDTTNGGRNTAGASVAFLGPINASAAGGASLTITAGTAGTIVLAGGVGLTTPLGALTLADIELDLSQNIAVAGGAVSETGSTVLTSAMVGSPQVFTVATTANGAASGNIGFLGTINGKSAGLDSLVLNAGTGTITLSGNIGRNTALGAITLSDAALVLSGNVAIATDGDAVMETGATLLAGSGATAASIDTTDAGAASAGANITFAGTIDGGVAGRQALALNAGTATIVLGGSLGATTPLGAITLSDGMLSLAAGSAIVLDGSAFDVTGALQLQGVGTTLIDTTGGGLDPAGGNITLGSVDGASVGANALTLQAGTGGTIALTGNLGGNTALGAVTLSDATLLLTANITTDGGAVSETGNTIIGVSNAMPGATVTAYQLNYGSGAAYSIFVVGPAIDTTAGGAAAAGGNVAFSGTINENTSAVINGSNFMPALTVNAGTGGVVTLGGAVGGTTPLGALVLHDGALDLAADITDGLFAETGATVLQSGPIALTASNLIAFAGTVDDTTAGQQALSLRSPTIVIEGNLGVQTALGAVTLSDTALLIAQNVSIVTSGGTVSETGTTTFEGPIFGVPPAPSQPVIDTTDGGAAAGANITFSGAIENNGAEPSLTLNAGDGTIVLQSIGAQLQAGLISLTLNDAVLDIAANSSIVLNGNFAQTGATVLGSGSSAAASIDTDDGEADGTPGGGSITFNGPIDASAPGGTSLNLASGRTSSIALGGSVGASTALGSVTLFSADLDIAPNAAIVTAGGAVTVNAPTVLEAGAMPGVASISTTASNHPLGANITFADTVDDAISGHDGLTLNAGTSGTVSFMDNVGGLTPLGALTLTDPTLLIGRSIVTAGGAVSQSGAMIIGEATGITTIDTTAGGAVATGANISVGGTINSSSVGPIVLTLDAGGAGTISLAGDLGRQAPLNSVTLSAAAIDVPASFAIETAGGAVTVDGAIMIGGGDVAETFDIDTTAGGTVAVGADIAIGALNGAAAGRLALTLDAGTGGTVALLGGVGMLQPVGSISLTDALLELGAGAGIATDGTAFAPVGGIVLLGSGNSATSTTIDTNGADITLAGPVNGSVAGEQALTLDAGNGTITLSGAIGAVTPLGALTLEDGELRLGANETIDTAGGAVTVSGVTRLLAGTPMPAGPSSTVTIDTAAGGAGGGAITFNNTIDGEDSGGEALTLNAGSGTITLATNVGQTTPLGGLSLSGGENDLNGSLYQTSVEPIRVAGLAIFTQPDVTVATVIHPPTTDPIPPPATTGAPIRFGSVSGPTTVLTLDPGIAAASIVGGTLQKIVIIEGNGSTLTDLTVQETSLGGTGFGVGVTVDGQTGQYAADRAFIRPGGMWTINFANVIITDPSLAGLSNSVLNNEGVGPAIALIVQIQKLIARGDTGETAAQQAFDQYPDRSNYAVDPFRQRYNILGVAQQEGVGGFEDISYIQDGFWEGLLKSK